MYDLRSRHGVQLSMNEVFELLGGREGGYRRQSPPRWLTHKEYIIWAAPWRLSESRTRPPDCAIHASSPHPLPAYQPIRWLPCDRCMGLGYLPGSMIWVGEDQTTIEHTR